MPPHPGGLELVVENLTRGLLERGHDVRWLASAEPLAPGREGALIRVPALNAFERRFSVPLPLWGARAHAELLRHCRWAEVVHVHDCLYPSSASAVLIAKTLRKPVVLTQHIATVPYSVAVLNHAQAIAYRTLGRALISAAERVVTYSRHVPEYFASLGIAKQFELIPLGFDPRFRAHADVVRREWRHAWRLPEQAKIVLFAGRLVAKKGIQLVVEVQRILAREGVRLVVAGSGPLVDCLREVPALHHLDQVPYERMHEIYSVADVLLLPSRGEGLPLTVQEAMLCGTPAVVSRDPSYVANLSGVRGLQMADSVSELASAVRAALAAPGERDRLAAWASQVWGHSRFVQGYESVLRESIGLLPPP